MTTNTEPRQRTVNLIVTLTEYDDPLPGSRSWLAQLIEIGTVEIGRTTGGAPAVFLGVPRKDEAGNVYPTGIYFSKGKERRAEVVAAWFAGFNYGDPEYHIWPFCDTDWDQKLGTDEPYTFFGVTLRPAAIALLCDFARKCRTLLKLRLRKEDQGSRTEKLKVKILPPAGR